MYFLLSPPIEMIQNFMYKLMKIIMKKIDGVKMLEKPLHYPQNIDSKKLEYIVLNYQKKI